MCRHPENLIGANTCFGLAEWVKLNGLEERRGKHNLVTGWCVVPANGGQLGLLLHFLSKDLQLLLERLFVVVGVDVVIIRHHR